MDPQIISEQQVKARKKHRCYYCGRGIVRGTVHRKYAMKLDDVYTVRTHNDCEDASLFIIKSNGLRWSDFDEGIPPLYEIIADAFVADCNTLRGHFPHVVARLELSRDLANARREKKKPRSAHR